MWLYSQEALRVHLSILHVTSTGHPGPCSGDLGPGFTLRTVCTGARAVLSRGCSPTERVGLKPSCHDLRLSPLPLYIP